MIVQAGLTGKKRLCRLLGWQFARRAIKNPDPVLISDGLEQESLRIADFQFAIKIQQPHRLSSMAKF